jgi:hypothetical protein
MMSLAILLSALYATGIVMIVHEVRGSRRG